MNKQEKEYALEVWYDTRFDDARFEKARKISIEALEGVAIPNKTGHWILAEEQNKEDVENDNYRYICSKCQCSDIHAKGTIVPYCWKCGRRMVEPQERSEE